MRVCIFSLLKRQVSKKRASDSDHELDSNASLPNHFLFNFFEMLNRNFQQKNPEIATKRSMMIGCF
jgi:hypothetical protein